MLEAAGLALGAFAGLRLGAAARDEVASHEHEDEAAQSENSAGSRRNSRTKLLAKGRARQVEGVVTVMLVGEAGVGKTQLCARLATEREQAQMALEGRGPTIAPTWRRAECDLLLDEEHADETRLCFQLLDTPGRRCFAELLVPFYRTCGALVLVFDVGSAASYAEMQRTWLERARKYRLHASRQAPASTVVLAHVLDERAEREVTRRDAASWCAGHSLPYFETHAKDTGANSGWRKMLVHLGRTNLGYKVESTYAATPGVRRSLTAASGGGSFKRALGPANGATPVGSFKLGGAPTPGELH